jgi:hypothetical protein
LSIKTDCIGRIVRSFNGGKLATIVAARVEHIELSFDERMVRAIASITFVHLQQKCGTLDRAQNARTVQTRTVPREALRSARTVPSAMSSRGRAAGAPRCGLMSGSRPASFFAINNPNLPKHQMGGDHTLP